LEKNDTDFSDENGVKKESLLKLQHIQVISKKRLSFDDNFSLFLFNEEKKIEINKKIFEILDLKNDPPYEDGGNDCRLQK